MDEKNHLGDKLRDKGKATEDLFIAEQERLRLAKRKQSALAGSGACPRDGDKLVARTEHGVTIDVCPTCHGVWLDEGEVGTVLRHQDEAGITRWVRSLLKR